MNAPFSSTLSPRISTVSNRLVLPALSTLVLATVTGLKSSQMVLPSTAVAPANTPETSDPFVIVYVSVVSTATGLDAWIEITASRTHDYPS